jgi:hypothetical protein
MGDKLGLRGSKLDDLVDDAARFNRDAGVSGILLFDGMCSDFVRFESVAKCFNSGIDSPI